MIIYNREYSLGYWKEWPWVETVGIPTVSIYIILEKDVPDVYYTSPNK